MNIKLSKKTKKIICIYIAALLLLYIVVEVLPSVTDIFETTQILKPGNLKISYETTGYILKDESVGIAPEAGEVQYLVGIGTAVKKGHPVVSVKPDKDNNKEPRYAEYIENLKGYDGLWNEEEAPISGVFSLTIDGYEDYFIPANMNKIKRDDVEKLSYDPVNLQRDSVIKGEPVYKISADDNWYVLCWIDGKTAETYTEGEHVTLELSEGSVDAKVHKIKKEGRDYRVIFYVDVYYEAFCKNRIEKMSIVISDNEGLIIKNKCIIEKNGDKGVYVKNKNGDYVFKKIKIISGNEKESVIEDATFFDDEGNQVYTVDVYDEVLKHPASALQDDLRKEQEEKELESSESKKGD